MKLQLSSGYLFLVVVSFFMSYTFGQTKEKIDSLLVVAKTHNEKEVSETFREINLSIQKLDNPELAIQLLLSSLGTEALNNQNFNRLLYRNLSSLSWKLNNIDNAIEYARKAVQYSGTNPGWKINSYSILAHKFEYSRHIDSVLYYANLIEKLALKHDKDEVWLAYKYRWRAYDIYGDSEKRNKVIDNIWDFFDNHPNHPQRGFMYYRVVERLYSSKDWETFNKYSIAFFEYFKNKNINTPDRHLPVGHLFFKDGYEKAIEYLKSSLQFSNFEFLHKVSIIQYIAMAYGKIDQADNGIKLLTETNKIDSLKLPSREFAINYLLLSDLYDQKNNYQKANFSLKQYIKYHNLWRDEIKQNEFEKFEVQFDTERKEAALELSQLQLEKASRTKWLLILGLVSLLCITGLLYWLFSNNKKAHQALKGKNTIISNALEEKEVLLREIHHRVKNNLQVVSSLLNLQSRQLREGTAKEAMQEGRNRVQSMALIHQNLYQEKNLVGVDTNEYFSKLTSTLINNYKLNDINLNVNHDIDDLQLDVDIMIPLGLITNELISNTLKHAFDKETEGQINLSLKHFEDLLILKVSDNGKGLPETFSVDKTQSLGYRLIYSFAKKLNATLKIDHLKPGTQVKLQVPYTKAA